MFCLQCGTSLPSDARFCDSCGAHQRLAADRSASQAPAVTSSTSQPSGSVQPSTEQSLIWEYCEIRTAGIREAGVWKGKKGFKAVATGPEGVRVIAAVTALWKFDPTAINRSNVDGLAEELIVKGWEPQPKGSDWYAYRFRRNFTLRTQSRNAIRSQVDDGYEISTINQNRIPGFFASKLEFRAEVVGPRGKYTAATSKRWTENDIVLGTKRSVRKRLQALADELTNAGWEQLSEGESFESLRFRRRMPK